jgi:hypothetical protein
MFDRQRGATVSEHSADSLTCKSHYACVRRPWLEKDGLLRPFFLVWCPYTYAVNGKNVRYERFMKIISVADIKKDPGMNIALQAAVRAWANEGPDPSNGAFWWDGVDFKTNFGGHPKVSDGFRFGEASHNIFGVVENRVEVTIFWKVRNKRTGLQVSSKIRGKYSCVWLSTAAHGKSIFWIHDPEYLATSGGKAYR